MLTNEKYIGNDLYNRTSSRLRQRPQRNAPEAWVRCNDAFQGIVPSALFESARRIIKAHCLRLSDSDMLARLQALLEQIGRGSLSGLIIDEQEDMPSSSSYQSRFGGLLRVYQLIGHQLEHQADSVWTLRQDATLMRLTLDKASVWGGGFDGDSMTGMTRYAGLFQMDHNRFNLDNQAQAKFRTGPVDHTVLLGFEFNRQTTTDSEVRARGIELNATGKLTPNLSLIAAYAFQNVKT